VLAAVGVAIGATLGALLPRTDTEDRLMGETSDQVKERAQDLAAQQYDAARKVGEHALDAAEDEAAKQAGQQQGGTAYEKKPGASVADEATLVPSTHSEHERQGGLTSLDDAGP
jgi:hypothetical protein